MAKKLSDIGAELVGDAQKTDTSRRGLTYELFPYIWVASKEMSTRTISSWLDEKHGLKLSPAMISKALRESDKRIRERVLKMLEKEQEFLRSLPMATHLIGTTALFDEEEFESIATHRNSPGVALLANETVGSSYTQLLGLYDALKEEWFSLPASFRDECRKHLTEEDLKAYEWKDEDWILEKQKENPKGENEK